MFIISVNNDWFMMSSQEVDVSDKHLLQLSEDLQKRYDYQSTKHKQNLTSEIEVCSVKWSHILIASGTVVFASLWLVSLPLCMSGSVRAGSDVFGSIVLGPLFGFFQCLWLSLFFKICLDGEIGCLPSSSHELYHGIGMGVCNSLACILQVFSSAPWRTPPHLQVLLMTCIIPFTCLVRYVTFRQGKSQVAMSK